MSDSTPGSTRSDAGGDVKIPPLDDELVAVSVIDQSHDLFVIAERLEYDVFVASGFCESNDERLVLDYMPLRDRSVFHAVVGPDDRPVGVVRSLIGAWDELPIGTHSPTRWSTYPRDPVCEYASLAVDPGFRGAGVAEALYVAAYRHARRSAVNGLVAMVDEWLLHMLRDHYGFAFRQLGPPGRFGPDEVLPVGVTFTDLELSLPTSRPSLWAVVLAGFTDCEIDELGLPRSITRHDERADP